jgi:hypothetical protein
MWGLTLSSLLGLGACAGVPIPDRYDHPFPGEVNMIRASTEEADWTCQADRRVNGCTLAVTESQCTVVVSAGSPHPEYTLRHETAHCNGWPGDHPR